jgi:hypothetical protein
MPDTLELYSFEDADGNESGTFTTREIEEAKQYAQDNGLRVIANVYEWSEAVPVSGCDYTGADADDDEDDDDATG